MDKRLELTEKQKEIISRYNSIVNEMLEANIHCIYKQYENIGAINGEYVEEKFFPEDVSVEDGDIFVEFAEITQIACPFGLTLIDTDYGFGVQFKEPR